MMRVVFMGTPEFAVPSLEAVCSEHSVVGVFTQTDKPAGRGKHLTPSPVKARALELSLPVFQPESINAPDVLDRIRALEPDVIVVVAYGQILKQTLLDIPRLGCINVHGSLLPKLRGAAPIHFALLEGFKETGVTTMYMARGLDSGDIIDAQAITIEPAMTTGQLHAVLMDLGAELLKSTLKSIERGTATRTPQDADDATYCTLIKKEMARVDWRMTAEAIERQVRAFNPWPVAFTTIKGERFKLFEVAVLNPNQMGVPGTILKASSEGIDVQTGKGVLRLISIQTSASKRMSSSAYLLGHPMELPIVCGD